MRERMRPRVYIHVLTEVFDDVRWGAHGCVAIYEERIYIYILYKIMHRTHCMLKSRNDFPCPRRPIA